MNTTDTHIAELLTGDELYDARLRRAFELGIRHGQVVDRDGLKQSVKIDTTKRLLFTLMRVQRLDLNAAMNILMIPKKEQSTYIRLLAQQSREKAARRNQSL